MMTTLVLSQTLASLPNSRLNTPIVPGPHTSWVMRMSTFTHTLSPAWTCALPLARARTFSVRVIRAESIHARAMRGKWNVPSPTQAQLLAARRDVAKDRQHGEVFVASRRFLAANDSLERK